MTEPSYTPLVWADSPDTSTPIDAANLAHVENGVKAATDRAVSSLRYDQAQSLTAAQQAIARGNQGLGDIVTHAASEFTSRSGAKPVGQGELTLNVADYGLKGDGTVEDLTSLNSAINAASNAVRVYWPPASSYYNLQTPLPNKPNVTYEGANSGSAQIRVTAGNLLVPTANVDRVNFRHLYLATWAGHLIELGTAGGLTRSSFTDCQIYATATTASAVHGNGAVSWQEVAMERCALTRQGTSTAALIDITTSNGGVNGSTWRHIEINNNGCTATYAISLSCTASSSLYGLRFEAITGEQCNGGILYLQSPMGLLVDQVIDYDAAGSYTASLVKIGKSSTGSYPRGIRVNGVWNTAGTVDGSTAFHVEFTSALADTPVVAGIGSALAAGYVKYPAGYGVASFGAWGASGAIYTSTASYTLDESKNGTVIFNGASLTATLPDPTTVKRNPRFTIKNANASALTVNSAGTSMLVDGAASQSLAQWAKATYVSDGTQWLSV